VWWQHAVFYEIYPRSFADSNNDGIGDLNGITSKMGYLHDLGVDAIWITPCYPSPQVDFGYDVSDYEDIDPMYGTLADFDHMVAAGKKHGVRIILDFVPNHTSDQHPWFLIRSPRARRRIATGTSGATARRPASLPITGSRSFGGIGVEVRPDNESVLLPLFLRAQPDLNWRNPAVETAMLDTTTRWWYKRGSRRLPPGCGGHAC
jgi:alpha-glucosidase